MKHIYKKTALLLAVLAGLAGCDVQNHDSAEKQEQQEVTLTVLVQQQGRDMTGTWEGKGAEKLYEDTGIRLEFYSNGNGDDSKLKQYMSAGTLPDVVGFRDMEQAELLLGANLLLDLDQYREQLSSVYETEAYSTALTFYRTFYGRDNSGLYLLPTSVGVRGEEEYYWMPMVQWGAYKKAGYPEIRTLEDYLDVAEKMLEKKPTTPLGNPVYGFSLCSDWSEKRFPQPSSLSALYGISTGTVSSLFEIDACTKTISSVTDDGSFYKRALHFYFEANQRGLLDPESRTQNYQSMLKKYESGQILFSSFCRLTGGYGQTDEKEQETDGFVALPAEDMKIYKESDNSVGANWFFGVNKNSQYPEKACEFLNWMYNPENIAFLYEQGEGSETGNMSEEQPVFQWLGLTAATVGMDVGNANQNQKENLSAEILGWRGETLTEHLQAEDMIQEGCPAEYMLDALPADMRKLSDDISEIVTAVSWEMIYAENEEAFESLWKQMQQQCSRIGMEQLKNYYNEEWQEALGREQLYGNFTQ